MIEKLRAMAIFSTVVEQGTFRGAAAHLRIAPSRVSETVSELEKDLGVTLLYRSTRQLSLTHEGRVLHGKVQEMLAAAESGLDALSPRTEEPQGALRVTAPAFVTQSGLMDTFARFAKAYPKVELTLDFSDQPRELIRDGFDVSIRAGWLKDSELSTRNIGYEERLLVASPEYVEARGVPGHPNDLEDWDWIRFSIRPDPTDLTSSSGEVVRVLGRSTVRVNSADALYEFATRGLGVTTTPETLARRGFERGELVHVLPKWSLLRLGLHALWPPQSRRENLTLLFVRFLAEAGAQGPSAGDGGQIAHPTG
ncbi:MAG: LysR family transcriptional regulator [Pseudomonadota bacterium]